MTMDIKPAVLSAFYLFIAIFPSATIAGSWGADTLSNDGAMDILHEVVLEDNTRLLYNTLDHVVTGDRYLDDEQASRALAAAELIAAMMGRPSTGLPPEAVKWSSRHSKDVDPALVRLALKAVDQIGRDSETRDLMSEGKSEALKAWETGISDLRERLSRKNAL